MPVRRRLSIGWHMAVVGLVAIDIALVRATWGGAGWFVLVLTVLPMLNLMALVVSRIWRPGPRRAFWEGFVAGGAIAVLGIAGVAAIDWSVLIAPIIVIADRQGWYHLGLGEVVREGLMLIAHLSIYTASAVLVAWAIGRLAERSRLRIERRGTADRRA